MRPDFSARPGSSAGSVSGCRAGGKGTAGLCLRPHRAAPQAGPRAGFIQPPDPRAVSCEEGRWAEVQATGGREPWKEAAACGDRPCLPLDPEDAAAAEDQPWCLLVPSMMMFITKAPECFWHRAVPTLSLCLHALQPASAQTHSPRLLLGLAPRK